MGMFIPTGEHHEGNPDFAVPIVNGFVGSFEVSPRGDAKTTVIDHMWKKTPGGFETEGTLLIDGGRLKQTLRLVSAGDQTVVYEDRVVALSDVTVESERGLPLGIENDQITGGARIVSSQDGQTTFDWQKPRGPVAMPGTWANVDGRVGIVMVAGASLDYSQSSTYSRGISVRTDILYGSYSDRPRQFRAGEEVAHRVTVFLAEATPQETSAVAHSCKIETLSGGQVLHFRLAGGNENTVPLLVKPPS